MTRWPTEVVARIVASFSARSELVVLLTDRTDTARRGSDSVRATVEGLGREVRVLSALAPVPALLEDPVEAQVVIAALKPHTPLEHDRARAWAALLRAGGILAILTHPGRHGRRLVDPTGPIVTAAQAADLLYLQHIVVLPTNADDIAMPPAHDSGASSDHRDQRMSTRDSYPRHRRVHGDLLIFINANAPEPAGQR